MLCVGVRIITFVYLSQSSSSLSLRLQIRFRFTALDFWKALFILESVIYSQEGTCTMIPKVINKMLGKLDNTSLREPLCVSVLVTHTHSGAYLSVCLSVTNFVWHI